MKKISQTIKGLSKFFFCLSFAVFIAALFLENSWLPELAASQTVLHATSTLVFVGLFFFFKQRWWLMGTSGLLAAQLSFIGFTYFNTAPFMAENPQAQTLTIAQYNTHYFNQDVKPIVDWLESNEKQFDIIFLQEVNKPLKIELERIHKHYPYRIVSRDEHWFERVFFSKLPITNSKLNFYKLSNSHYLEVTLRTPQNKDMKFYGIHAMAPISPGYLDKRNTQFTELMEAISKDTTPYKIIAGDFNMTPYSRTFRKLCERAALKSPRTLMGSWPASFKGLPPCIKIDHLLVSKNIGYISQENGTDAGSDHLPIITKISLL